MGLTASINFDSGGWVLSLDGQSRAYVELEEAIEEARRVLREGDGGLIETGPGPDAKRYRIKVKPEDPKGISEISQAPVTQATRDESIGVDGQLLLPDAGAEDLNLLGFLDPVVGFEIGTLSEWLFKAVKGAQGGLWSDGLLELDRSALHFRGSVPLSHLSPQALSVALALDEISVVQVGHKEDTAPREIVLQAGVPLIRIRTQGDDSAFVQELTRVLPHTQDPIEGSKARPETQLEQVRARFGLAFVRWKSSRRGNRKQLHDALVSSSAVLRESLEPGAPDDVVRAFQAAGDEIVSEATLLLALVAIECIETLVRCELDPVTPSHDRLPTLSDRVHDARIASGLEELTLRGFACGAAVHALAIDPPDVRVDVRKEDLFDAWFQALGHFEFKPEVQKIYEALCFSLVMSFYATCEDIGVFDVDDEYKQYLVKSVIDRAHRCAYSGIGLYMCGLDVPER